MLDSITLHENVFDLRAHSTRDDVSAVKGKYFVSYYCQYEGKVIKHQ